MKHSFISFNYGSFKHIASYALANFISRGVSFLALPAFTYYISEKGFGILAIINNSVLFFTSFILFSLPITLTAEYVKRDKESYNNLFTSLFLYLIVSTILSGLFISVFFEELKASFGFEKYYIFLLPLLTFFNFFSEQLNNYLRLQNKSITFLIVNVSRAVVEIAIAFFILYLFKNDYYSRIISIFFTSLIVAIYSFYYFFFKMKLLGKFRAAILLKELPFGFSFLIWQIGIFLVCSSDKFFINYFYSNQLTGIYNIASTFAAILFIFSSSAMSYFTPDIYKILSGDSSQFVKLKKQFRIYILLVLAASVVVLFGGTIAYLWLIKKTYLVGFSSFCILILGNIFWAIGGFFHPILWYYRAKRTLSAIALFSVVISIPCYFFLIKYFSLIGAAFSLFIICGIVSSIIRFNGMKLLKMNNFNFHA